MSSLVRIDGNLGEGGGQVLRIALCLSSLYRIPIEIQNIRAKRPKPGLAAQHLRCVELVKEMCNARVTGGFIGSTRLEFYPGQLNKKKKVFVADTQTAGCICLLAQVALPCALFLPRNDAVTLIFKGGTNVPMGPHIEYLTEVFKPILNKFGANFDCRIIKRGYYPKGGGEVHLIVKPIGNLNAVTLIDPGIPQKIRGWSYVAGVIHVNEADRMANDVKTMLTNKLMENNIQVPPITIETYKEDGAMAVGNGSGINVVCDSSTGCVLGGSGLGSGRKREGPPQGVIAAKEILKPLLTGACVDEHMQDQMIILMSLAKGTSRIKVNDKKLTCHTETAIIVAEIMLHKRGLNFNLLKSDEGADAASYILECQGCGLINNNLVKQ